MFILYIRVQQQDVVCQKTPKVQNMVVPTIQLHGRQIHDYVVRITLVHIVSHVMVSSRILIDSAIMLALMSSSLFILLLYLLVMNLLIATHVPRYIFGGTSETIHHLV